MDIVEEVYNWRRWILKSYESEWRFDPVQLEMRIRWSIFIITGVCAGLPALVWSVSDIIHHRKNGHRVSIFIILLLLTDFLELFLSPYILINYLLNQISCYIDWKCWVFRALWWVMKDCGLLLNQLVGLEGMLPVICTAPVYSSPRFRIIQLLIFLCVIIWDFSFPFLNDRIYVVWVCFLMFIVLLSPLITTCGTLYYAHRRSHTSREPDLHILVIFLFSQLLHLPDSLLFFSFSTFLPFLLTSLRLISDPLLCVLVCRQELSLQTSQKPEGLV